MSIRTPSLPNHPFPVLPLRRGALFPGTSMTIPIGRPRSVALARSLSVGDVIGVAVQRDAKQSEPLAADLYPIGTVAVVQRVVQASDRTWRLVIEGVGRFRLHNIVQSEPFWYGEGEPIDDVSEDVTEERLLAEALRTRVAALSAEEGGSLSQGLDGSLRPGPLADRVAAGLNLPADREVEVLSTLHVAERLRLVSRFLTEMVARTDMKRKIESEVRRELTRSQKEVILREQLRAIQKELGQGDEDGEDEVSRLRKRIDEAGLPEEARAAIERDLNRLAQMSPQQAEYNVIRNVLELVADLPWSARAEANDDLRAVEARLEADHYGLEDVKRRILEHMAVLKLAGTQRGTILCLAGPPGVGKTSLGQSIADATGRPFVRLALGGVRDEAEVRGHRRTYVGARHGRILNALKTAGKKNAVILLDEIDKLSQGGWSGNPEAALLEVLDPAQNHTFTDHYLELPFDLSEVLFICTANSLENISRPLLDRLEIIEIGGYTMREKQQIARRHLIPKQLEAHAIRPGLLELTDEALEAMIGGYTREAGVRQLTREFTRICRGLALEIARGDAEAPVDPFQVDVEDVRRYLGRPRFHDMVAERTTVTGVATGLAWTPVGGDILFVETSFMPGKGQLQITGQLGEVMKESAQAALTYVRSHAEALEIDADFIGRHDLHIHVPAGAVPKDGPSAGVTIFTALTSLLTGRRVRSDTAMTGECTLRGRVLPVGGIKAKVLAAHRAGLRRVILPARNGADVEDVPEAVRSTMEFVLVEDMAEVIAAALEPAEVLMGHPHLGGLAGAGSTLPM